LRIGEESQDGSKSARTDADRRAKVLREIETTSVDHQVARLEATKTLATKLTPLVNQYIELSDQTTVEAQRELCEYIRGICHASNLAVKCPKTGIPTVVFANPRSERKNPLRVVFKSGNHETYSETHLQHLVLVPAFSVAEGHAHRANIAKVKKQDIKR
jgi:ribosomal protein L17